MTRRRTRLAWSLASTLLLAGIVGSSAVGCPDPDGRFDDFEDRVPDAAVVETIDAMPLDMLPDVTGQFYVAFNPSVAPDLVIHFIVDYTLTKNGDGTGTIDMSTTALDAMTRMPVGPTSMLNDIAVSTAGEFAPTYDNLLLPATANPLTGAELLLDLNLSAKILDADSTCGVAGAGSTVVVPAVPLVGSTFGGQRITPGTLGAALPVPITHCPTEMPDGGLPDAAPSPDAGADAAPAADADLPDAA